MVRYSNNICCSSMYKESRVSKYTSIQIYINRQSQTSKQGNSTKAGLAVSDRNNNNTNSFLANNNNTNPSLRKQT